MRYIKVLVVDDSAFMCKIISDMINSSPDMRVVDTAKNGLEAIEKVNLLKPDVITLDIEMPVLDGLSALEKIMKQNPLPVIMLSSLTRFGTSATIKALDLGAIDFITKPTNLFRIKPDILKDELINKIRIASEAKVKPYTSSISKLPLHTYKKEKYSEIKKIVAIGTSTGGPRALQTLISKIPRDIDAAFVIVQHMPPGFTKSLAERLNSISHIMVKEAEKDDILLPGHAYIAPGDYHMKLLKNGNEFKILLTHDPPVMGHRPSVDVLMNSIADTNFNNIIGVILTGMGSDGTKGLINIKKNNGYILAQDEKSCVVFGMPKSAINSGIVDKILPIDEISNEIIRAVEV